MAQVQRVIVQLWLGCNDGRRNVRAKNYAMLNMDHKLLQSIGNTIVYTLFPVHLVFVCP